MFKLLRLLKHYRLAFALVLVLSFAQTIANLYLPNLMADIVDTGIIQGDTTYILQVGGLMLAITIAGVLCAIGSTFYAARVAVGIGQRIRSKLFTHVTNFSLHEFDSVSTASLITRTTNDTTQVQQVLIMMLTMMIAAPLMCIGGIVMALAEDIGLSWILVVVIPILVITIGFLIVRATPLFKGMQVKIDTLNLVLDEGLTGVRVVRAFDRVHHESKRFDAANHDLTDVAIRVNRMVASLMPIMMLVMNAATIAIIWFGGIRIDNGEMQVGSLMAFMQYAMQIMFSLLMVSMMFVMIPRASASADRINEVLAMTPEINDAEQVRQANDRQGYVDFQHVTFSYPGAEEPALLDISFSARPGQVTAIIGGTGAGKSTLVGLIPRFYDVDQGHVLVNGVDVREMSQEDLRAKIGFVPQKAVLFTGSISDNIRYGRAQASPDEIQQAATIAQASEFIAEKAEGYDSIIAQGGINVSGGQKQRLSIARALVRNPEIYVFDDSFSALDFKTDARLRSALKREILDATVLIVAQRVSTIMDADQILVLDQGRIVDQGTHQELMANSHVYREIVSSQLSMEEIA